MGPAHSYQHCDGAHRRTARPLVHRDELQCVVRGRLPGIVWRIGADCVIMIEYINQLRARGYDIEEAAVEGAVLRLRPIIMTMLVATLGLLPAAVSHGIGSDSQRPFAIVIVGGLVADLVISVILLPTLYVWLARSDDKLPLADSSEAV